MALGDLKKRYIDIIDLEGDKQGRSTNVKASMTSWTLNHTYDECVPIAETFADVYKEIIKTFKPQLYEILTFYHGHEFRFSEIHVWGAKYKSKEKARPHDHLPAFASMCLYLKTPKGCPGLSFNEISKTIAIEEDQMIIFDSSVKHSVKSKKFRGCRYILAGNINIATRYEDYQSY